ncbi:hypothetical protein BRD17_06305 [Halobacteriales archaeon SW_7_68_16]|nr:MAG: hypothetical protein BRD17_06305 [Halobacteriales archaeon SW_7_68_16]
MSESRAFCPRCGDAVPTVVEESDGVGLCNDCYFTDFELVDAPEAMSVDVCSECGAIKRGQRWVDADADDYTDVAVEGVTEELGVHVDARDVTWAVDPEQIDANTVTLTCHFSGIVRGERIEESVTVPVTFARGTCGRCGRIAGGSFAATVQVRAIDRTPDADEIDGAREIARSYVDERIDVGDRNAFITEMGEVDDGLNVKVSTTQIGRAIAERIVRQYGGRVDDSRRLITEEDGERVYRMAYAVRLPPYRPGEVIDPEDGDGPALVRSVRGNLKGVRLATGDAYEADAADGIAPDATSIGTREDGVETTLVAVEDDHAVQILDPETYAAETVPRPDYLDPDAETVTALRSRAGLHVLPPAE